MKISVVIPVYNEEKYIAQCLRSLQNQTHQPNEIIVVDNNCTDKTIAIARKFKVKIVTEKKQGMVYSRNKGYNSSQYEIIARCDADSLLPEFWIKRIKEDFKQNNIIGVSGPCYFYDYFPLGIKKFSALTFLYFKASKILLGQNVLFGSNMAIKKEVWQKTNNKTCLKDDKVHEDTDLSIHIGPYGKIKYDKDLLIGMSARRLKHSPFSILVEYPTRWFRTILSHRLFKISYR